MSARGMHGTIVIVTFCSFCILGHYANSIRHLNEISTDGEATGYLVKYGYLPNVVKGTEAIRSNTGFNAAISHFQMMVGLNVTGELNNATKRIMSLPRCGVPDVLSFASKNRTKRFVLQGSKWHKNDLTYKFTKYPSKVDRALIEREIAKAFKKWSDVTPLTFTHTYEDADIEILYTTGYHGDLYVFDGPLGVLAHAFYPSFGGDAHFDDDENWTSDNQGINIYQAAAHELGHSLGLLHSDVQDALMAPIYKGDQTFLSLHEDDVTAIQAIYGPPSPTTNPTRTPVAPVPKPAVPVTTKPNQPAASKPTGPSNSPTAPKTPTAPKPFVPKDSPPLPIPKICYDASVDAITRTMDGTTYAFKGLEYYRLTPYGYDYNFPRNIFYDWGISGPIDAALTWRTGYTIIFQGFYYYKYINRRQLPGYPRLIRYGFPGVPGYIDAAFEWEKDGATYFIKGSQIFRYSRYGVDYGFPRPLTEWRGIPVPVSAAFKWDNKRTYFFSGGVYYRFNDYYFKTDSGYPRETSKWWFACISGHSSSWISGLNYSALGENPQENQVVHEQAFDLSTPEVLSRPDFVTDPPVYAVGAMNANNIVLVLIYSVLSTLNYIMRIFI